MNQITPTQRQLNIISKALNYGFIVNARLEFEDVVALAEEHLIDAARNAGDERYEEADVTHHTSSQHASWSDGMGFDFTVDGELISYHAYRDARFEGSNRVVFHWVVDSMGEVVGLYESITE